MGSAEGGIVKHDPYHVLPEVLRDLGPTPFARPLKFSASIASSMPESQRHSGQPLMNGQTD